MLVHAASKVPGQGIGPLNLSTLQLGGRIWEELSDPGDLLEQVAHLELFWILPYQLGSLCLNNTGITKILQGSWE